VCLTQIDIIRPTYYLLRIITCYYYWLIIDSYFIRPGIDCMILPVDDVNDRPDAVFLLPYLRGRPHCYHFIDQPDVFDYDTSYDYWNHWRTWVILLFVTVFIQYCCDSALPSLNSLIWQYCYSFVLILCVMIPVTYWPFLVIFWPVLAFNYWLHCYSNLPWHWHLTVGIVTITIVILVFIDILFVGDIAILFLMTLPCYPFVLQLRVYSFIVHLFIFNYCMPCWWLLFLFYYSQYWRMMMCDYYLFIYDTTLFCVVVIPGGDVCLLRRLPFTCVAL